MIIKDVGLLNSENPVRECIHFMCWNGTGEQVREDFELHNMLIERS